jgi:hypothetical protein
MYVHVWLFPVFRYHVYLSVFAVWNDQLLSSSDNQWLEYFYMNVVVLQYACLQDTTFGDEVGIRVRPA